MRPRTDIYGAKVQKEQSGSMQRIGSLLMEIHGAFLGVSDQRNDLERRLHRNFVEICITRTKLLADRVNPQSITGHEGCKAEQIAFVSKNMRSPPLHHGSPGGLLSEAR